MKKIIYIAIVFILVLSAGLLYYFGFNKSGNNHGCDLANNYEWCDVLQKCIVKEKEVCKLPDDREKALAGIKQVLGMELGLIPKAIKWNDNEKEIVLDGSIYYYTDLLKSEKINNYFKNLQEYLKNSGFSYDSSNQPSKTDKKEDIKYKKDNVVCNLTLVDNPNQTSSLSAGCAFVDKLLYDVATDSGIVCKIDSDCKITLDACNRKIVCRNASLKYYNNCANPSNSVSDIDFSVGYCQCLSDKCAPKKAQ